MKEIKRMLQNNTLRHDIIMSIDKLPESKVYDVLQYIRFLIYQQGLEEQEMVTNGQQNPAIDDPLAEFVGGIEHGGLAADIDKELYG
jgi:hypothetical protein